MSVDHMPAPTLEQRATREPQSLFKNKAGTPMNAPQVSERGAVKNTPSRATASDGKTY